MSTFRDQFNISIYGSFTGPAIRMSVRPKNPVQPELAELYKQLNFRLSSTSTSVMALCAGRPRSNLMVAHRGNRPMAQLTRQLGFLTAAFTVIGMIGSGVFRTNGEALF
ncbi:MAG: hypothetical protein U1F16_10025 [Turneriella sp.]